MTTGTRKKELTIKANEGMIFDNGDGTWSGALKIDEEYFEVNMTSKMQGDRETYDFSGTSASDAIEARSPLERRTPSQGGSGKSRPEVVGMVRTQGGNLEKELAGWMRTGGTSGKTFLSVKISDPRQN